MLGICFKLPSLGGGGSWKWEEAAGSAWMWGVDGGGTGPFCSELDCVSPNSHVEALTPGNYKYDLIWREDGRVTS